MVGGDLLEGRRQALATLARDRHRRPLTEDELGSWLTATNDLRLVLGTRLGVTDDTQGFMPLADDPQAPEWVAYNYLSWLQEEVVAALSDAL